MSHLLVVPIILPGLTAAILCLLHRAPMAVARALSIGATACLAAAAFAILTHVQYG